MPLAGLEDVQRCPTVLSSLMGCEWRVGGEWGGCYRQTWSICRLQRCSELRVLRRGMNATENARTSSHQSNKVDVHLCGCYCASFNMCVCVCFSFFVANFLYILYFYRDLKQQHLVRSRENVKMSLSAVEHSYYAINQRKIKKIFFKKM